jgi:hypothetical protein
MTATERFLARQAQRQAEGIGNREGGRSYFHQGGNGKAPTPEEVADAVQWQRGVETAGHQTFTFKAGPDFGKLLADTPVNEEAATGLHIKGVGRV